jgi:WS/DGAT/MGAT family acyltransferase
MGGGSDWVQGVENMFIELERDHASLSIGMFAICEGPTPAIEEFRNHVESHLGSLTRWRQLPSAVPLGAWQSVWADDDRFELEHHVRHSAVGAPGGEPELFEALAAIFSKPLDRSRPLWEVHLLTGLDGGRFAYVQKCHHAMMDGISQSIAFATMCGVFGDPSPNRQLERWRPTPAPSAVERLADGVAELARTSARVSGRALRALAAPRHVMDSLAEVPRVTAELARLALEGAPSTPLNAKLGPRRQYVGVPAELATYKRIKDAYGATINDVVLTVAAGGLARLVRAHGLEDVLTEIRPMVPVSIRGVDEAQELTNRVVTLRPRLPLALADPVERLIVIKHELQRLKASRQATAVGLLARASNLIPTPMVAAAMSRVNFSPRLFNVLITNVPGPPMPVSMAGRPVVRVYPVGPLVPHHALAIAATSVDGGLNFGLLADPDVLPDLDVLAAGIADDLAALERAAGSKRESEAREPVEELL